MNKLLVIGAGIGQVNIVKLAKNMNLHVTVVSPKGNYPAIDIADELFECDIYDRDRIVEFAKNNGIIAVTSDQNDLMMPTVAYVSEKCGLPGNSFEQVLSYCDKTRFRSICEEVGVPIPANVKVTSFSDEFNLNVEFPWIIKPADSQSSIGISRIDNLSQYKSALELALSKSKTQVAIVERFFKGQEYVCEGFVFNGKYHNIFFGDRRYFKGTLIPSQTLFPSELSPAIQNRIIGCEEKISRRINASFGIVHSEYIVNPETDEFIVVESAIRGGGVYISSHLVPLATGLDVNSLLLQCALGKVSEKDVDIFFKHRTHNFSAYVCFYLPEGKITEIKGVEDIHKIDGVYMSDLRDLYVGATTSKMTAKGMRKGPFIVHASSRSEIDTIISELKKVIKIVVSPQVANSVIWD